MYTTSTTSAGRTMTAEHLPAIQVITSEERASAPDTSATALEERAIPLHSAMRRRSPSPSRRGSSVFPNDNLGPQSPGGSERPSSAASDASSVTLSGAQASPQPSAPEPTYLPGPFTAEPAAITIPIPEPDEKEVDKPVYLAPVPADFCSNIRYERRERLYVEFAMLGMDQGPQTHWARMVLVTSPMQKRLRRFLRRTRFLRGTSHHSRSLSTDRLSYPLGPSFWVWDGNNMFTRKAVDIFVIRYD